MIISRTPFRISFAGGGSDYPAFYKENGGTVLSTSINKYCYITIRYLPPFFDHKYRIRYTLREETQSIAEIKHPSVRECLNFMQIDKGIEVLHTADLPAMAGLGSSSSFTVGMLNALSALKGGMVTKRQLALNAIHIEQDLIKENVGSQDQTIAAFGGLNKIDFGGPQEITISPVTLMADISNRLQSCLMLFFTGFSRYASEVAAEQNKNTTKNHNQLLLMKEMVNESINALYKDDIVEFGKLLHQSWEIKRTLTKHITNPLIDEIYDTGIKSGAIGGKLLGAGNGGFMLFLVMPELQDKVKESLNKLLYVPFSFENLGSQIIYYAP